MNNFHDFFYLEISALIWVLQNGRLQSNSWLNILHLTFELIYVMFFCICLNKTKQKNLHSWSEVKVIWDSFGPAVFSLENRKSTSVSDIQCQQWLLAMSHTFSSSFTPSHIHTCHNYILHTRFRRKYITASVFMGHLSRWLSRLKHEALSNHQKTKYFGGNFDHHFTRTFNISVRTLLWNNEIKRGFVLSGGETVLMLGVSFVQYGPVLLAVIPCQLGRKQNTPFCFHLLLFWFMPCFICDLKP